MIAIRGLLCLPVVMYCLLFVSPKVALPKGTIHTWTFESTGTSAVWPVPAGVQPVSVTAWGAQGDGVFGGLGSLVQARLAVTPGERLMILVGGRGTGHVGGFNGGGAGGFGPTRIKLRNEQGRFFGIIRV